MKTLALDPGILVFPDEPLSALSMRLDTLRFWASLRAAGPWLRLAVSRRSKEIIIECGLYPAFSAIRDSLGRSGLSRVYSANDICVQVNQLLDSPDLEGLIALDDALWENLRVEPDPSYCTAERRLQDEVLRILVLLAIVPHVIGPTSGCLGVASPQQEAKVSVKCLVQMVVPEELALKMSPSLPREVQSTLLILRSFEEVYDTLNPRETWETAKTAAELRFAISLKCRERMRSAGAYGGWASLPKFHVGEHFLRSLRPCQACEGGPYSGTVLDRTSMVVLRTENVDFRPFLDQNGRQITRAKDSAKAFRIHVTKEHEALRLMVWERQDGSIELANLGLKAELHLSEGDPDKAS